MFELQGATSSFQNRWIGVLSTSFITMVWCDLWYYSSFEELSYNGYSSWYSIIAMYISHVICAFTLLDLCSTCHVRDAYGLFLAAAISGWILTGIFQTTFYDTLPVSVSWRGLCWYALFSVFIGLWLIRTLLHNKYNVWLFVLICILVGITIACWAVWWMHGIGSDKYTEYIPPIASFSILLFISTGILILSYFMLDKLYDVEDFVPSKLERIVVYLCIAIAFVWKIIFGGYFLMMLIAWLPSVFVTSYFLIIRYRNISIKVRSNAQQVFHALSLPTNLNFSSNIITKSSATESETDTESEVKLDDGNMAGVQIESALNIDSHFNNIVPLTQVNLAHRDMISDLTDIEYEKQNLWVLLIIPCVASLGYLLLVNVQKAYGMKFAVANVINITGIAIGFGCILFSIWRIIILNERVFLRNNYQTQLMNDLDIEAEVEREIMNNGRNNPPVELQRAESVNYLERHRNRNLSSSIEMDRESGIIEEEEDSVEQMNIAGQILPQTLLSEIVLK